MRRLVIVVWTETAMNQERICEDKSVDELLLLLLLLLLHLFFFASVYQFLSCWNINKLLCNFNGVTAQNCLLPPSPTPPLPLPPTHIYGVPVFGFIKWPTHPRAFIH